MKYATNGTISINGEKLIELQGFLISEGEVILSDSDSMSNFKKVKIKFEPSALRFWMKENKKGIKDICDV